MHRLLTWIGSKVTGAGRRVISLMDALHRLLVWTAVPFGIRKTTPWKRWLRFLLAFGVLFALSIWGTAWLALAGSVAGLWAVVAISRAWAENEDRRRRIAKKIESISPDSLPDLRGVAMASGLLSLLLLPILAASLHQCFGLFQPEPQVRYGHWLWFLADKTYLKSIPDFSEFVKLHQSGVELGTHPAANIIIVLSRLLVYYFVLQTIYRLYDISSDIGDAVAALHEDYHLAVRVGSRAKSRLIRRVEDTGLSVTVRGNAALALGHIQDPEAFETLRNLAMQSTEELRAVAVRAIGKLSLPESIELLKEKLSTKDAVREQHEAAQALGEIKRPDATHTDPAVILLDKLAEVRDAEGNPDLLKYVIESLGRRLEGQPDDPNTRRAIHLLFQPPKLTTHKFLRVCNRTAVALGKFGNPTAVRPLIEMLDIHTNPKLLVAATQSLGMLAVKLTNDEPRRREVIAILQKGLRDSTNESVLLAIVEVVGKLQSVELEEPLRETLTSSLRNEQVLLREAVMQAFEQIGGDPFKRAKVRLKKHNRNKFRQLEERLMNANLSVEERCQAARDLPTKTPRRVINTLRLLHDSIETPTELRECVLAAIERIDPNLGKSLRNPPQP